MLLLCYIRDLTWHDMTSWEKLSTSFHFSICEVCMKLNDDADNNDDDRLIRYAPFGVKPATCYYFAGYMCINWFAWTQIVYLETWQIKVS